MSKLAESLEILRGLPRVDGVEITTDEPEHAAIMDVLSDLMDLSEVVTPIDYFKWYTISETYVTDASPTDVIEIAIDDSSIHLIRNFGIDFVSLRIIEVNGVIQLFWLCPTQPEVISMWEEVANKEVDFFSAQSLLDAVGIL